MCVCIGVYSCGRMETYFVNNPCLLALQLQFSKTISVADVDFHIALLFLLEIICFRRVLEILYFFELLFWPIKCPLGKVFFHYRLLNSNTTRAISDSFNVARETQTDGWVHLYSWIPFKRSALR